MISDLTNYNRFVHQDDTTIHAPTKELHDERLRLLLERFREHNAVINPDYYVFSSPDLVSQ